MKPGNTGTDTKEPKTMKNTIKRRAAIVAAVVASMVTPAILLAPAPASAVPLGTPTSVDNEWLSFPRALPGMAIGMDTGRADTIGKCTAGVIGKQNGKVVLLTAGHCRTDKSDRVRYATSEKNVLTELGHYTTSQDIAEMGAVVDYQTDFAVIEINKGTQVHLDIAGKYEIERVLEPVEIREGMEVCKFGFRTQETCGQVDFVDQNMVRVNLFSKGGDSGSPAYVKLGDNKVALVGLLSGSPCKGSCSTGGEVIDGATNFALLAPILKDQGVSVLPSQIVRD